jgi:hypothetical protein
MVQPKTSTHSALRRLTSRQHHRYEATAGGEGSGSINPFVRGLFSGKEIATQMHPRNEEAIVAAQQPVELMRNPST